MKIKSKRVLKNGAVAGYVYYSDEKKWKWRIVGHINSKKGGFRPNFKMVCTTERCKTTQKYQKIENNKYSSNNKNNVSAQIKARLATLHNTGFFNTYYKKMLKKYEKANENGNSSSINVIIKNLKKHKNKKYKKNVNKNSKRGARNQYLENTIKKIEKEKKEKEEKEKEVLEQLYNFITTLDKNINHPEAIGANVLLPTTITALNEIKKNNEEIYKKINHPEAIGANVLLPTTITALNEIKKNNEEIYKKIKKIINKIIIKIINKMNGINITGQFNYGVTNLYSALTYINKSNQNQINKNSNEINEKFKTYIIDFIKKFDLDLFEKIPDKQIEDFMKRKKAINNNY